MTATATSRPTTPNSPADLVITAEHLHTARQMGFEQGAGYDSHRYSDGDWTFLGPAEVGDRLLKQFGLGEGTDAESYALGEAFFHGLHEQQGLDPLATNSCPPFTITKVLGFLRKLYR